MRDFRISPATLTHSPATLHSKKFKIFLFLSKNHNKIVIFLKKIEKNKDNKIREKLKIFQISLLSCSIITSLPFSILVLLVIVLYHLRCFLLIICLDLLVKVYLPPHSQLYF